MAEAAGRMFGADAFSTSSFATLQELTQKNLKAFHQALGMFSPFGAAAQKQEARPADIEDLRSQLTEMQKQLDALAKKE